MGYFEGLVEATLKKDKNGNTIFYPWGVLGKGRVLADPAREAKLRLFLLRFYQVTLPSAIIIGILRIWFLMPIAVVALTAWFLIVSRRLLADAPISDERLALKEAYKNSATKHNKFTLSVLFIFSFLFVIGGIFVALKGHGPTHVIFGVCGAAFFALCSLAIGYMLSTKRA